MNAIVIAVAWLFVLVIIRCFLALYFNNKLRDIAMSESGASKWYIDLDVFDLVFNPKTIFLVTTEQWHRYCIEKVNE